MEELLIVFFTVIALIIVYRFICWLDSYVCQNYGSGNMKDKKNMRISVALDNPTMVPSVENELEIFSTHHPDAVIGVYSGTTLQIEEKMKEGEIDIGIFMKKATGNKQTEGIKAVTLYSDISSTAIEPIDTTGYMIKIVCSDKHSTKEGSELSYELVSLLKKEVI